MALAQKLVRELFDYDAESGRLVWRVSPRARVQVGDDAGCKERANIRVQVAGRRYAAHQLIWLWMTGDWPKSIIDHIDGCPHNNAWRNLRLANTSLNAANKAISARNKFGMKGVSLAANGKFYASIKKDGRSRNLGFYETPEAAHAAYMTAARELFGEFARAA